ncbi:MAG: VWA domain-containing protein [Clostridiales bacterium]|nr:VWA domain-containing protein [Clostridiales bacterium]
MGGSRIQNARHAVEACISNMEPEMQESSILMYENNYHELSPLTNEIIELRTAARQIGAHGGTSISAGLYGGIESLKNAVGTKAIILMTDGEDGNPSEMPNAINAAKAESIAVFTVSMGGGDHNYMQNIANETGGSFMEAVTDEELVKVYTALQNYIVNNYCFEYTVENDNEANPRILTIELKEHKVSSTRTYSHSKLILTEDESYITRTDHTIFRLRYAEPSVVSVKDAELGVPVFINADGVIEGTKVFINGNEIKDIKVIDNMAVSFVLRGKYDPGNLDVTFKLPNGTSKTTSKLLSVSDNTDYKQTGQTIVLGRNGNTIYADKVEKIDDYTLKLSGNVILNGFVRTTSIVTVHSSSPISSSVGRIILTSGEIYGSDAAYIDFRKSTATNQNYGQKVFGGESVKVLELYSFYFDKYSIGLNHSDVALNLPGFGEVYAYAQFDGTEFTYTINKGCTMSELQNNLNYAINSIPIPLPQNEVSNAVQVITGLPIHNDNIGNSGYGLNVQTDNLNVTICDEFANIIGTCAVNGYLGLIEITNGNLSIDTTKTDVMYELSGMANFTNLQNTLKIDKQTPIVLKSYGLYPDSLSLNATGLSINASELSECFNNNSPPKPLESAISVNHPLNISNEPYKAQISSILSDISLDCDRIEFICTDDREQNGLKAFDSSNPDQYIRFTQDRMIIPINAIDELSLFGSDLGGEISGSATIKNNLIDLNLIVDGHLDNPYYSIRHDGRANIAIQLPRNTYAGRTLTVTVSYGKDTLTYDATTTGNIVPQDGFTNYAEDYEQ